MEEVLQNLSLHHLRKSHLSSHSFLCMAGSSDLNGDIYMRKLEHAGSFLDVFPAWLIFIILEDICCCGNDVLLFFFLFSSVTDRAFFPLKREK